MLTSPPNLLTVSRIVAIPAMVGAFYLPFPWSNWLACAIFSVAAVTDYFDGYLAREWQMQSDFGRMLDPIADKLLVAVALMMLVSYHRAPLLPAVVILCRELLVSGMREFLAGVRVGLPVSRLAKWKTGVQMTAIAFLLVGAAGPSWLPVVAIGWWGLWLAALLTLITGYDYLVVGLKHAIWPPQPRALRPAGNPSSRNP